MVRGNEWVRAVFAVNRSQVTLVANGTKIVAMDVPSEISCSLNYDAPGCLDLGSGFTIINSETQAQTFRGVGPAVCASTLHVASSASVNFCPVDLPVLLGGASSYYSEGDVRRDKLLGWPTVRDNVVYPDKYGRMIVEEEKERYGRRAEQCVSGVSFFRGSDWSDEQLSSMFSPTASSIVGLTYDQEWIPLTTEDLPFVNPKQNEPMRPLIYISWGTLILLILSIVSFAFVDCTGRAVDTTMGKAAGTFKQDFQDLVHNWTGIFKDHEREKRYRHYIFEAEVEASKRNFTYVLSVLLGFAAAWFLFVTSTEALDLLPGFSYHTQEKVQATELYHFGFIFILLVIGVVFSHMERSFGPYCEWVL